MLKFEPALQDVADKILHDLPEELAAGVSFKLHEGGDALVLSYPASLHGTPDMQMLDTVVHRYGGAFVSRGKGNSFYLIPKPKLTQPPVSEKPQEEPKPAAPVEAPKPVDVKAAEPTPTPTVTQPNPNIAPPAAATEPLKEQPIPPPQEKAPEPPFKQPSPLSLYREKYCSSCEDQGTCRLPSNAAQMQLCVRMLEVQFLDGIAERLFKIGQALETLEASLKISGQVPKHTHTTDEIFHPAMPPQSKPSTPPTQQPPKVQRDTNPREGIEEDGLVWVKVFDGANVKYLKAYEKDNQGRQRFADLSKWIEDKKGKSFTKLHYLGEECQVFLWNFNQGPVAIGKSRCKER